MSERNLSINEVAINTFTVEIKALLVGKKQMTLSVFRQLPRKEIICINKQSRNLDLLGSPWGTVNYFWGCGRYGKHIHVVWSDTDGNLYRACVSKVELALYHGTKPDFLNWVNNPDECFGVSLLPKGIRSPEDEVVAINFVREHNEMVDKLASLEQLFIAV